MTRLILVRHGRPLGHEGRCVGHWDCPLSDAGSAEIRAFADAAMRGPVALPTHIVTSDLARTRDSARVIANTWSIDDSRVRIDARLRESHFGDWEGRTWEEIAQNDPTRSSEWAAAWTTVAPPNGESFPVFRRRVRESLDDILTLARTEHADVAVIGHAGWIRVAAALLLHEDVQTIFERPLDYAHACVFDNGDEPRLLAWNSEELPR